MRHATLRETLVIRKRRKRERERERTKGGKEEGGEEERKRGREEGGRERERREGGREEETYCNTSYTIVFANSLLQYEYDHRLISRNTHL